MAKDVNRIYLEVSAKTNSAKVEFDKLGKSIDKVKKKTDKAEKGFGRWRIKTQGLRRSMGALRNNMLLFTFAVGGSLAAISKLMQAYGEQELAERKLQQALGFTSQALLDQASALQQQTTFGDEAIIGVQSLIAAFTNDEEVIKKLTKTTLDLASAKGMDLRAAADLVSKSFGSATNALSRYGITVEGAVGSTERLESLTGNISDLFGGQARADLDTYTGRVKAMKNAMGDTAESMGAIMAPMLVKISKLTKNAAEFWTDYFGTLDKSSKKTPILVGKELELTKMLERKENALKLVREEWDNGDRSIGSYRETSKGLIATIDKLRKELELLKESQDDSTSKLTESEQAYLKFATTQQENLDKYKQEQKFIEFLQSDDGYPGVAEALGLQTDAQKEQIAADELATKKKEDLLKIQKKFRDQVMKDSTDIGRLALTDAKAAKNAAIDKIGSYAQAAAAKQMEKVISQVPFPLNAILAIPAGLAIGAAIQAAVGGLQTAQYGMNEIVDKPTMILAGEAGAEQVSITPLESPNLEGVQGGGGGITVNVSGNVLSSEWVEGELADNIREAVRRGTDFGIG